MVFAFRDISDKRARSIELLKAQKLDSLGILAGGIAHDFNNILTGILANISFVRIQDPANELLNTRLKEAEKACFRAKDLTQQLLTFARGGKPITQVVSIENLVRNSTDFALRGSKLACEFKIPKNLWPVEIDEGQINQVIHNLVINADQAMPEGGVIKVTARNMKINGKHHLPLPQGAYIRISFKDRGHGIQQEHLPNIFDPYFTTKQQGSGLGLATSYSIIANHNGTLTVDSASGKGSTFHIYLPASDASPVRKAATDQTAISGNGKILVMDDDETITDIVKIMLGHIGFTVESAGDGKEALSIYQKAFKQQKPFDAVILDLTIPAGMGGKEAIEKLLAFDPSVRAIVSSGYSNDPVMSNFREYGFMGCITKPFNLEELSTVLNQVTGG